MSQSFNTYCLFLLSFFITATAFSQITDYKPGYFKHQEGERDSNGDPIGEWKLFSTFSRETPLDYFNYDTRVYRSYYLDGLVNGKALMLEETGKLNEDFKKSGTWTYYHNVANAKLVERTGDYVDGKMIGTWTYYHPNGQVFTKINYTSGEQKNGNIISYDADGAVLSNETYEYGKKEGPQMITEQKSRYNIKTINIYKDNKKQGMESIIIIPDDGEEFLVKSSHYENGFLKGTQLLYNDKGVVIEKSIFPGDSKYPTEVFQYTEAGVITNYVKASNNFEDRSESSYYASGKLYKTINIQDNKIMNVAVMQATDGTALDAGTLSNGNGILQEYNDEGEIVLKKNIKNGINLKATYYSKGQITEETFFDEYGDASSKVAYENGKKVKELTRRSNYILEKIFKDDVLVKKSKLNGSYPLEIEEYVNHKLIKKSTYKYTNIKEETVTTYNSDGSVASTKITKYDVNDNVIE
ncbi:MAG: hypothetical protein ABJN73_00025 [Nonlabens ulvanivorans]